MDDGLATGSIQKQPVERFETRRRLDPMRAAAIAVKQQKPSRSVVAVPVVAPETCEHFRAEVDEVVCAITPEPFRAVGLWYEDFTQTTDDEVHALLAAAGVPARSRIV